MATIRDGVCRHQLPAAPVVTGRRVAKERRALARRYLQSLALPSIVIYATESRAGRFFWLSSSDSSRGGRLARARTSSERGGASNRYPLSFSLSLWSGAVVAGSGAVLIPRPPTPRTSDRAALYTTLLPSATVYAADCTGRRGWGPPPPLLLLAFDTPLIDGNKRASSAAGPRPTLLDNGQTTSSKRGKGGVCVARRSPATAAQRARDVRRGGFFA